MLVLAFVGAKGLQNAAACKMLNNIGREIVSSY